METACRHHNKEMLKFLVEGATVPDGILNIECVAHVSDEQSHDSLILCR